MNDKIVSKDIVVNSINQGPQTARVRIKVYALDGQKILIHHISFKVVPRSSTYHIFNVAETKQYEVQFITDQPKVRTGKWSSSTDAAQGLALTLNRQRTYDKRACKERMFKMPLPTVKAGSTGRYVKLLQMDLNGLAVNYNGFPVNGVFEKKTEEALKNFQDRFDLKRDGIAGPATWKVVIENVKAVQRLLNSRGYPVGYVDGWFGTRTTNAVKHFQQHNGLYSSGIVAPRTRQQLFNPHHPDHFENRPTSLSLNSLNPHLTAIARHFLALTRAHGLDVRIRTAFRSWDEQDRLFAQGRWTPGQIVTNARGGGSYHNWGLAFDAAPFEHGHPTTNTQKFIQMGHLGEQVGLKWGGTFKSITDYPHFQYTFGLKIWDLLNGMRPPS